MPIFEYKCKNCSHITEFLERADFQGEHICDNCGGRKMGKLLSTFSAQISGSSSLTSSDSCPTGTCPLS